MLLVDKVEAALDWYRDVPPVQWVSVALGSIEIMLAQKEAAQVRYSEELRILKDTANFIAYLYVTDVDSLYAQIKAKAAVIMDPTDRPYGTAEFAVRDPFACALVFAQTGGEPDPVGAGLPDSIGHRTFRKRPQEPDAREGVPRSTQGAVGVHRLSQRDTRDPLEQPVVSQYNAASSNKGSWCPARERLGRSPRRGPEAKTLYGLLGLASTVSDQPVNVAKGPLLVGREAWDVQRAFLRAGCKSETGARVEISIYELNLRGKAW